MIAARRPRRRPRVRAALARRTRRSPIDRYLAPGERVLLETRQHPIAIIGAVGGVVAWLIPLLLVAWGLGGFLRGRPYELVLLAVAGALIAMTFCLCWLVVGWELERVFVTDEKVIHLSGVLSRRIASTPLAKVSELTVRQSLLGRMLDYGALVVDVPGGREQALHGLAHIPDPVGIYRLVGDRRARPAAPVTAALEAVSPVQVPDADPGGEPTTVIRPIGR